MIALGVVIWKSGHEALKQPSKICERQRNNALHCFLSQPQAKIVFSYFTAGSFSWSTHRCLFPVCDTLHMYKENVLRLVLEIVWMNRSFTSPGEGLQPEVQWPLEIIWVAAEENHRMEKGEGRGRTEKKRHEESRKGFERQVRMTKRGKNLIYSLVQFGRQAARIVWGVPRLLPPWGMSWFLMKTMGGFLRTSSECWFELGRSPQCTDFICKLLMAFSLTTHPVSSKWGLRLF